MKQLTCAATLFAVFFSAGGAACAQKADTTTQLAASANPSVFGHPVTFTATVTAVAPGSGTPTGTVTFSDGSNMIGRGTLNGAGQATFTTSGLFVGRHTIVMRYAGDGKFNGSQSDSLTQNVAWASQR
jgi:Big-like domain-containing protein